MARRADGRYVDDDDYYGAASVATYSGCKDSPKTDRECHEAIRVAVITEARRIARETWPSASDDLVDRLAARGIRSALLAIDPDGRKTA